MRFFSAFLRLRWPELTLIGFAALFCWPIFVPGWHMPQGGGDLTALLWPMYAHAAETLRNGALPLWNPYLYSGAPFLADSQSGVFYPPNLLLFLALPKFGYLWLEVLVAFHLWLTGQGMYLLMRRVVTKASPFPALAAALALMGSSVMVTHIGNLNILAAAAYLPWAVWGWAGLQAGAAQNWRAALPSVCIVAPSLALSFLAGQAQFTWLIVLTLAYFAALRVFHHPHRFRLITLGVLAGVLALGLAAIHLLSTLELTQATARAALSVNEATRWSLPWPGLAEFFSPLVFGRGVRDFWATWERAELGYAGLTTLALAAIALTKWRGLLPVIGLLGLSLLFALGQHTPIYPLLVEYIPTFNQFRAPARFVLLTDFALAWLAAVGLSQLLGLNPSQLAPSLNKAERVVAIVHDYYYGLGQAFNRYWPLLVGLGVLGVGVMGLAYAAEAETLATLGSTAPNSLPLAITIALLTLAAVAALLYFQRPQAIVALLAVELFVLGAFVEVDQFDPSAGFTPGPAVSWLAEQPGPFRIDTATSAWQPDAPRRFGLESITGLANPLALAEYDRYYWSVGYRGSPQYNFLNVKFLITDKDSPAADSSFVPVYNQDPQVDIYLNTNALPRIQLIHQVILAGTNEMAFTVLHSAQFDPSQQVIIMGSGPQPEPPSGPSNLYYTQYSAHRHTIYAETSNPAYLVLSEVWYPGWQATINGEPTPIYRANVAFRAVYLPAGQHTIRFEFQPRSLYVGTTFTTMALLACIGLIAIYWRTRPSPP